MTTHRSSISRVESQHNVLGSSGICLEAAATSGKAFHVSHAVFFPRPENKETVLSQTVKAKNICKILDLRWPKDCEISLIGMKRTCFPVSIHISSASVIKYINSDHNYVSIHSLNADLLKKNESYLSYLLLCVHKVVVMTRLCVPGLKSYSLQLNR